MSIFEAIISVYFEELLANNLPKIVFFRNIFHLWKRILKINNNFSWKCPRPRYNRNVTCDKAGANGKFESCLQENIVKWIIFKKLINIYKYYSSGRSLTTKLTRSNFWGVDHSLSTIIELILLGKDLYMKMNLKWWSFHAPLKRSKCREDYVSCSIYVEMNVYFTKSFIDIFLIRSRFEICKKNQ